MGVSTVALLNNRIARCVILRAAKNLGLVLHQ